MSWTILDPYTPRGGGDVPEFDGVDSNILVTNSNVTVTPVTSNPSVFVISNITTDLAAPVAGYDSDFISGAAGQGVIEHNDTVTHDYKIEFSGTIVANSPGFFGSYIGVRLSSDLGQSFKICLSGLTVVKTGKGKSKDYRSRN